MNSNNFKPKTNDQGQKARFMELVRKKGLNLDDLALILSTVEFNAPPKRSIRQMLRAVDKLLCGGENA